MWEGAEKPFEFLEGVWHGRQAHGTWPHCRNDLVDDHGCCLEQLGDDGAVVVEHGTTRSASLLLLEEDTPWWR